MEFRRYERNNSVRGIVAGQIKYCTICCRFLTTENSPHKGASRCHKCANNMWDHGVPYRKIRRAKCNECGKSTNVSGGRLRGYRVHGTLVCSEECRRSFRTKYCIQWQSEERRKTQFFSTLAATSAMAKT